MGPSSLPSVYLPSILLPSPPEASAQMGTGYDEGVCPFQSYAPCGVRGGVTTDKLFGAFDVNVIFL